MLLISVFIENETGSLEKRFHDEQTLEPLGTIRLSRPCPYPYGFIPGTTAEDGTSVDCYVITRQPLRTGETVQCTPFGLLEQFEDGEVDHKVLAVLPTESAELSEALHETLRSFIEAVLGDRVHIGSLLPATEARDHIRASREL